ncbi:ferrous iron transport protein B [Halanaerobium saccharolyticum]|uniref:Ferrous iron transport protein B n=1 Tax=Halanaerobium saccharolyticum TaxID=43595 RepID=A0A4R6M453_9FIRM|nr:ferrous iron transport protein B [Halanaerobium saccharolyticum]TDO94689.1 ferrous iron transport protein B [Halanaerobium saccharolyticum]
MECCDISHQIDIPSGSQKIVLAGNPNVGKSIFFNKFTGIYVAVSNYPGTTLDISSGMFNPENKDNDYVVLDTPGVYGVSSFNDEEAVARDVILAADAVVNIVDAVHLERDLFLTQQIIDMGIPVIVALNMMDEAERNGLKIDIDELSSELGVPVITTTAIKGEGLEEVKNSVDKSKVGNTIFNSDFLKEELDSLAEKINSRAEALLIMEGDPNVAEKNNRQALPHREKIYKKRRHRINNIIDSVISENGENSSLGSKIGHLMLKPLTGIPMLLATLYLLYELVGVFVAQTVVGITEETFFLEIYEPFIRGIVTPIIPIESFFGQLFVGEFGLFTMTVTYTFGLLLPLVAGFYFFLAILEDSGYMPRIAALVDRLLTSIGLNGRAIIPMLLGFGCVTMATITTRLLGSKRERIIATFLLGLAIPCSAQLGVIAGLIAPLGFEYFAIYVLTIFVVYVLAGTILNKVLPGKSTDLLIDIPPLRMPRLSNVLQKTYMKSKSFIKEAGPIFAIGALIITVMQETGMLTAIQNSLIPLTVGWLQLPKETATVFIMGIIRRDFGAAGLNSLSLTAIQTTVSLVVITLFVPCIAAMMTMFRERNWKEALFIWFGSWFTAFGVGGILAYLL